VLTNLKLSATNDIAFNEVYPAQMPDLFHGQELMVLGRFTGKGPSALKLTGMVGMEPKEFAYDVTFPDKTGDDKKFVEEIWARRKVGYLLDQIRANGEKKELVDEVVALAKKYGITTPYTSYLVVPDAPVTVARGPLPPGAAPVPAAPPVALRPEGEKGPAVKLGDFVKGVKGAGASSGRPGEGRGGLGGFRGEFSKKDLESKRKDAKGKGKGGEKAERAADEALAKMKAFDRARELLRTADLDGVQGGKLGVDLSEEGGRLRQQSRLTRSAVRRVLDRNLLEVGGVWIDEGFDPKMKSVTVKAMSKAYFRILERQPSARKVFQLGNHVVWVTPSSTALLIDTSDGVEEMTDADIDRLFTAPKKKS
jgi:Ca-activated chloride channel family protein